MYFVYALYNKEVDKIYIGQTSNVEKRLVDHNKKRGNHFTAKVSGEWKLIYKEKCSSRQEVIKREKELKSFRGREFIKNFIVED